MARIRNIVMEGATGRLGSMVLTQRAGTGTVARTLAPEVSNPKSDAQQTRRVKWANLVNFYKVSKGWMAKAFENKASNQSDYNKFMSLNANTTLVALTKDQASQGGVIAGPYTISQGSLPSIELTQLAGGGYATNIAIGSLSINSNTKVSDFSVAVLDNNSQIKEGMQLSFISYQQQTNGVTGVPYVVCGYYEVTLNRNDTRVLDEVFPVSFAAASVSSGGNYLGTGSALSNGSFAYVLSSRQGGKILVSTQQLQVNNNTQYILATSTAALEAAIESYGRGSEVFLAPGYAGGGQSQTGANSVQRILLGTTPKMPGISVVRMNEIATASTFQIEFSNDLTGITSATVKASWHGGVLGARNSTAVTIENNLITVTGWSPAMFPDNTASMQDFIVTLGNGREYSVQFAESTIIE